MRDLDVLLEYLRGRLVTLDGGERDAFAALLAKLESRRGEARARLLEVLDGERYLSLLGRLEQAAEQPRLVAANVPLERLWSREFRRLRRTVGELGDAPTDEALHEARIRAKRARYAAELAEPALGKATRGYLAASKRVQDVLGEHQDAVVAEGEIRSLVRGSRSHAAQLAAGRLVERQRARRAASRAGRADVWRRLERAGERAGRR